LKFDEPNFMSPANAKAKPARSGEIIVPDKLYFRIGEV
jgi:hypothetical protein